MARPTIVMLAALASALAGCGYNRIQGADEEVKAAWAEVANQYQRRADLIPNLVATVKGAEQRSPMRAVCTPEDVSAAIVGLVAGPDLVTGQVLVLDGGMTIAV